MKKRTQRKEEKSTGWRGSPAKGGRATVEPHIFNRRMIGVAVSTMALWAPIASAQDTATGGANVSLLQAFFIQRNPRSGEIEILGSLIVWLLLAMSVASIALIGVFLRENRREAVIPPHLVKEVRALAKGGNKEAVLRFSSEENSYLAKVLRSTLAESEFGRAAMLRALERSSEEYTAERLRRVETLNIFGSVAPMIGLFGTVYGMILAFSEIVASGGSPDPVGLAAGIGTALTTTFWGLVVAIPALSGYAFIRNGVDALTSEASLLVDDLVNHMRSGRE